MVRCGSRKNCCLILARSTFGKDISAPPPAPWNKLGRRSRLPTNRLATGAVALQLKIELLAIFRRSLCFGGGHRELVPQTLGQPLCTLQSKPFEMIVHVSVDGTNIRKLSLDLQGPAFHRGFAFPKQFSVAMPVFAVPVIFSGVITEQPDVEKVGGPRLKCKRRQIALIERRSVRPNPADAMFFQKMNELWSMPAGMAKFDGKTKIPRQLFDE